MRAEEELILMKCREFVREQSQGEWGEHDIEIDALKMAVFVNTEIANALRATMEKASSFLNDEVRT